MSKGRGLNLLPTPFKEKFMGAETVGEELKSFNFKLKTDMRFGIGISRNVGDLLGNYNFGRLCLIVDSGVLNNNKIVHFWCSSKRC